jgi:hypothetical protein
MKSPLFSLIAGVCLIAATACSTSHGRDRDEHRSISPRERARFEAQRSDNRPRYDNRSNRRDRDNTTRISKQEQARLKAAYRAGQRD